MAQEQYTQTVPLIPDATTVGPVHLKVTDLADSLAFYRDILGYQATAIDDSTAALGAGDPDFVLHEIEGATENIWRTTGLFHAAILLPERRDLAAVVQQLVAHGWDIGGASDHGVSEALYLNDPDDNGLEIYIDRPREQWPVQGDQVRMVTERLDFDSLFAELGDSKQAWNGIPTGTRIGHVHLQVSDLEAAKRFYVDLLGFTVMQDTYPGALFVAAGGYHHHIGMNTWAGKGVPRADENAVGLARFAVNIPDMASLEAVSSRLQQAGADVSEVADNALFVRDQDGIEVELRVVS